MTPEADRLAIVDGAYASDGGSTALSIRDASGTMHGLLLVQHMFLEPIREKRLPGRMYWDGDPVEVRSARERAILSQLNAADIVEAQSSTDPRSRGPGMVTSDDIDSYYDAIAAGRGLSYLVSQVIAFVSSDEYVEVARRVEQLRGR